MVHDDTARLLDMVFGFIPAQVVRTMATLDLADRLADGPVVLAELAKAAECHEPSLRRLLRAAAHLGLVVDKGDQGYELTSIGRLLRADVPGSAKFMAMQMSGEPTWSAAGRIDHTVRTGRPAVEHVFGKSSYEWMADNPRTQALFYQWMMDVARHDVPELVAALDLTGVRDIVDVGGGNGILMAGLLAAHPGLVGTVFDQAASLTHTPAVLAEAGVADRCTLVAGDFLADALPEGRDAYLIKSTLSDWPDDDVVRILRACHEAMREDSVLLVIDMVLPDGDTTAHPVALMSDLCTLACGGAVRTEREFGDLFASAGLRLVEIGGDQAATVVSILRAAKN
ncbi:methyltransferase [Actinokineospora sp. UTMC 2448]|uniref:methyltransferase n=1 Tax=Actinokineospora sp. UTMC 2448 TaxID=2268449 RepID=UPI0021643D2F|nr:methyltransferase [Actinokineospora sp. UTMC 2448]UVS79236.1 Multifunctional cyclase-dehydratase-3-O-methyl transferase TcmN [Actinokineospora sp. UTMC 2448]